MAGMFDDVPMVVPIPVYGPGSAYSGQPAAAPQGTSAYVQSRDTNAPAGSARNPSFDTPDLTGADSTYHVDQQGRLHAPQADVNLAGMFDDVPMTQVGKLPKTAAIHAALADNAARNPDPNNTGSLNVINGFLFGREPQVDAGMKYVDTLAGNGLKRLLHQPISYTPDEAYAANKAADQDRLAAWQTEHPIQGLLSGGAGAALNPINRLALLGGTAAGVGATARLMALGRATAASGALGGAEGALYGSSDPNDPVGGAERGAVWGAAGGAAAVPAGAALSAGARGAVGTVRALAAGPIAAFGDAVRDLTPGQISAVQSLRSNMAARGVDISVPEAVQQVTNNGTALGRMQRILEGTKRGEQLLSPYFADRTSQVQGAVRDFADRVASPTELPSAIGPRAQQAAQGGLNEVRTNINAQAQPHYDAMAGTVTPGPGSGTYSNLGGSSRYVAAPGQAIPEDAYAQIAASHAYRDALGQVRGDHLLNAGIAHLPDNDTSVVNEVVKQLDRNVVAHQQTATNPGGNNYKASLFQNARDLADQIATQHSPQWRAARDTVAAGRQWLLDPLEAGPVGQIARTDSVPGQVSALYPSKPLNGASSETEAAMRVLNNQFPGVGADLTRQHIMMSLDGARPELSTGPNPYLGSSFAVKVAGSPERQAALMSGVNNIGPHGPALADDLGNLLEGLRATGKRQPAGSKTAFNESDLADWHVPKAAKFLESFSLAEPLEPIAQLIKAANYRRNVNGLAQIMTTPADQTAALLARAQAAAPSVTPTGLPMLPYSAVSIPTVAMRQPNSRQ